MCLCVSIGNMVNEGMRSDTIELLVPVSIESYEAQTTLNAVIASLSCLSMTFSHNLNSHAGQLTCDFCCVCRME